MDLNSTAKGGLLLSNVSLTDLEKIPGGVFVGIAGEQDNNTELTGMIVYNTNVNTGRGLYVWNGVKWTTFAIGDGDFDPLVPGEVGVLTDPRDNETYLTGNFGTAGIWMLENLRYVTGYTHSVYISYTSKYYGYPGANEQPYSTVTAKTNWNKSWGVLYNWAGATNGRSSNINESDKSYDAGHPKVQGVCPDGWYLPSDWEWNNLEEVIAAAEKNIYSSEDPSPMTSGFRGAMNYRNAPLGRKMKSTSKVTETASATNGTSKLAAVGGFDALLVGIVLEVEDDGTFRRHFGTHAYFWSSSSYNNTYACGRYLTHDNTGVNRYYYGNRSDLYSVRCKKD
ncbi:MAG: fibrobacter succinogenes major paralogous domain-containing protein [Dysgonamonadaceae bacterium]|nr:fibrobacter succinogenes major paralogous domain-containing protein [Dysgonamonadaceae bacterium]